MTSQVTPSACATACAGLETSHRDSEDLPCWRTADRMRVDGEPDLAAPIERILLRCKVLTVMVYAVPDEHVGDQVMAALVLRAGDRPGAFSISGR